MVDTPFAQSPPLSQIWAGALSLLLQHHETVCAHSARQAARLLECLSDAPEVDAQTRCLCERASLRLSHFSREGSHVCPA